MNLQLLHQKLKTFDEAQLTELHGELVEICTKRRPEGQPDVRRQITIIETTDSGRGSIIQPLLGKAIGLEPSWIPANSEDRLHLNTILSFESNPDASKPEFVIEHSDQDRQAVNEKEALACIRQASHINPAHIHIAANFESLPAGWTMICHPPMAPNGAILDLVRKWSPESFWILSCRDQAAGVQILEPFKDHPETPTPLLVRLSDSPDPAYTDEKPDFCCHIPFLEAADEATSLIQRLLDRVQRITKPGKESLIYSILLRHENAAAIQNQAKDRKNQQTSHEIALEQAASDWQLLFLNERREAIRDIQLESVAHMMTKFKLLTRNARQARVAIYAQDQLYPRVRNLIGRFLHNLKALSHSQKLIGGNPEQLVEMRTDFEDAAMIRSGILHALPSLGLLLPISMINGSEARDATQKLLSGHESFAGSGGWLHDKLSHLLEPITDRLDETNDLLGDLVGVLVASAAGMAIGTAVAGAAASFVIVRGSIVLHQTEHMIRDLIDETEQTWPRVEENLRALILALNGDLDERVIKNANRVIQHLEKI